MCSSPARSASSAATRRRSIARRASPCSCAARAAINESTDSPATPLSNALWDRCARMSNSSCALYGGNTIFSSLSRLFTRGSSHSVNFRSLLIPIRDTFAFVRSSLIFRSWYRRSSPFFVTILSISSKTRITIRFSSSSFSTSIWYTRSVDSPVNGIRWLRFSTNRFATFWSTPYGVSTISQFMYTY